MVIEADIELTLQAGGSFIKLDPGGITLVGPLAKLNAGGAPGKGTGLAILKPLAPGLADSDKAGDLLERIAPGLLAPWAPEEPREYRFNIVLQDVPGEEGFPLAHTSWRIEVGDSSECLMEGETDGEGRVLLDECQQQELSKAYASAPRNLWLAYPGQRVSLRLHLEEESGWDAERYSLAALDFDTCLAHRAGDRSPLGKDRSQQDTQCTSDLYTYLHSKE